jgi:undecaprenyl-diphosphatase
MTLHFLLGSPAPAETRAGATPRLIERLAQAQLETLIPVHVGRTEVAVLGAGLLGAGALLTVDVRLYAWLQKRLGVARPVFDQTLRLGDGVVDLLLLTSFALGDGRGKRVAIEGAEAMVAVALVSTALKRVFRVSRPEVDPARKHYWQPFSMMDARHDALPSGHTMSAFATAAVISGEYPDAAPWAYSAASLVGLSVMMRGWHWPSDVALGAALGYVLGKGALAANQGWLQLTPASSGLGLELHAAW